MSEWVSWSLCRIIHVPEGEERLWMEFNVHTWEIEPRTKSWGANKISTRQLNYRNRQRALNDNSRGGWVRPWVGRRVTLTNTRWAWTPRATRHIPSSLLGMEPIARGAPTNPKRGVDFFSEYCWAEVLPMVTRCCKSYHYSEIGVKDCVTYVLRRFRIYTSNIIAEALRIGLHIVSR